MPKFTIHIARFMYDGRMCHEMADWVTELAMKLREDPRFGPKSVFKKPYCDTPVTISRNLAVQDAQKLNADYLLMCDDDLVPDDMLREDATAKPFWESSIDFLLSKRAQSPAIIAAPYCGAPPFENVFVFRWENLRNQDPNKAMKIEAYSRHEAAMRAGVEEVACLPTGLMLIDMRAFNNMGHPYFEYEYSDKTHTVKHTTEDVFFSRNNSMGHIPQYVNWDAWCGHWKKSKVRKPSVFTVEMVRDEFRDALLRGYKNTERLIILGEGDEPSMAETKVQVIQSLPAHANGKPTKMEKKAKK